MDAMAPQNLMRSGLKPAEFVANQEMGCGNFSGA